MNSPVKFTKVMYTCKGCDVVKREVECVARAKDQNIVEWFEGIAIQAIAADHKNHSPACTHTKADIMFQLDNIEGE